MTSYHDRFITGIKLFIADSGNETYKDVAPAIGIPYMSLWKIMSKDNRPTVEQCIALCNAAGFSANWLLLGIGEKYYNDELKSFNVLKELKKFNKKFNNDAIFEQKTRKI